MFAAESRNFSDRCIRVRNVFDLVERLADDPAWSKAAMLEAVEAGRTRPVNLRARISVLLACWTATVASEGLIYYLYEDIYGRGR